MGNADDVYTLATVGGQLPTNKRGNPIYRRDHIREQYCVTRKELAVFERLGARDGLFGCLSPSDGLPDNNCGKKTFALLPCVQRPKDEEADLKR